VCARMRVRAEQVLQFIILNKRRYAEVGGCCRIMLCCAKIIMRRGSPIIFCSAVTIAAKLDEFSIYSLNSSVPSIVLAKPDFSLFKSEQKRHLNCPQVLAFLHEHGPFFGTNMCVP
jgi:hypothetical protein